MLWTWPLAGLHHGLELLLGLLLLFATIAFGALDLIGLLLFFGQRSSPSNGRVSLQIDVGFGDVNGDTRESTIERPSYPTQQRPSGMPRGHQSFPETSHNLSCRETCVPRLRSRWRAALWKTKSSSCTGSAARRGCLPPAIGLAERCFRAGPPNLAGY